MAALLFAAGGKAFADVPVLRSANLKPFVGLDRLLIIFPGHGENEAVFLDQLDQWSSSSIRLPMERRSLRVFQVVDPKIIAALRKKMSPHESGFRVWLIGISDVLVLSTEREVEPSEIFERVDGLPRRSDEIRLHNEWDAGSQTGQ